MMNIKESKVNIVKAFAKEWAKCSNAKSILHIKASTFHIFDQIDSIKPYEVSCAQEIPEEKSFDLILGDFPLYLESTKWKHEGETINIYKNWIELLKSLSSLSDDGASIALLEPFGFAGKRGQKFEKELNRNGFHLNAIFNTPHKLLSPETHINPIITIITRKQADKILVTELLDIEQAQDAARAYFSSLGGKDCIGLQHIQRDSFCGFDNLKISQQIERLETQYKSYKQYTLNELAIAINSINRINQFQEQENAIYIPCQGNDSPVISFISDAKMIHQNYIQVILKDIALNEYVSSFFKSTLGKLVLSSFFSGTVIPFLNREKIKHAMVPLPSMEEQLSIAHTERKLNNLRKSIDKFDEELALNPNSSTLILKQLDNMLDVIGSLTDADKIRRIIREGESKQAEFKETLSLDVKKQSKESYIEVAALKTIVGFLNTAGGCLVIGVADNGNILGVNTEINKFHKSTDKFLLQWKNLIKTHIGEEYYPYIDSRIAKVDDKDILLVECRPSESPCFLDKKDFYVRTNPATDKLEGAKLLEYVNNHFRSKDLKLSQTMQ
ncbi:MAG: putative DNA binding domain-containing protein [Verrucomicrobia bacterium]|nr:putative DNA binding domain-containing protein [Verrucomicrobiota bacterium]